MKIRIELEPSDVQEILADKFGCNPEDVLISITDDYEGYGPTEHKVHKLKIFVRKEEK